MKKFILLIVVFCVKISFAQNTSDIGKIALWVALPEYSEGVSENQLKRLETKINQIVSTSGMASYDYTSFAISPRISIQNTELIEGGIRNITQVSLDFDLLVNQPATGSVFSTYSAVLKGSGTDKEKAIANAITKIQSNSADFKQFIGEAKTKILEYYESKCPSIIAKAEASSKKGQYEEALALLMSIPEEVGCYATAQSKSVEIYKAYQAKFCNEELHKAEAFIANKEYSEALSILMNVDSSAPCFTKSKTLMTSIQSKINAQEKKEWDLKMKMYNDAVNLEKQRINAAKEIAVAYYKSQKRENNFFIVK